jgi:hypothetical protein
LGSKKGTIVTIVSVAVALIVALATIQSTQASIDYWLQKPEMLTHGLNQVTVYCKNGGGMDGDFDLIVKFGNATFSKQTELPYTQIDETTIRIKFVLHPNDEKNKTLYFSVNQAETVSVTVNLEKASLIEFVKANALFPTKLSYQWNQSEQSYTCINPQ